MAKPQHQRQHQIARAELATTVTPDTLCVYCRHPLGKEGASGGAWHLAHDDARSTDSRPVYLGPSHSSCNSSRWSESPRASRRSDAQLRQISAREPGRISRRVVVDQSLSRDSARRAGRRQAAMGRPFFPAELSARKTAGPPSLSSRGRHDQECEGKEER